MKTSPTTPDREAVLDLLDGMAARGLRFEISGGTIFLSPAALVTAEDVQRLRAVKPMALEILGELGIKQEPPRPRMIRNPTRAHLCRNPGCERYLDPKHPLRPNVAKTGYLCVGPGCWFAEVATAHDQEGRPA